MKTLNVHEIRKKPVDFDFSVTPDELPALKDAEESGECRFLTPIRGTIHAEAEFDHIRVSGSVSCVMELSCSRCLKEFPFSVDESFTVFYAESTGESDPDPEIELAEQDLLSATYEGDEISLLPEISDQILMQVPIQPLCDERCKGLCPVCGTDKNEIPCTCGTSTGSRAFAALSGLRVKSDKGE